MSNDKARQIEVNNEIILLRQFVRQARICVISRLVREAKKLRALRGNEKQLERNKNKADKLLKEVFALKDIKDDEISKFGIINSDNLQDMLENRSTDDGTKAMIKIARYKHLNEKILKFKEKFPDYREFVRQKKNRDSTKRKERSNSIGDISKANRLQNDTNTVEVGAYKGKRKKKDTRTVTDADHSERAVLEENENENDNDNGQGSNELSDESMTLRKKPKGRESKLAVKVISKEAAVKRFAEVLGETDPKEESSEREEKNVRRSSNDAAERSKRIDDFFLSFDEAGSSDAVSFVEGNDNRRVSELDHRAFEAVRVKSKEGKFYKDNRERREKGRKDWMDDNNYISRGPSTKRNMSVTRSDENEDTRFERTSRFPKRNIENTIEAKDENLHPSWAARKKQQEMMMQVFQGKKIKFDDY